LPLAEPPTEAFTDWCGDAAEVVRSRLATTGPLAGRADAPQAVLTRAPLAIAGAVPDRRLPRCGPTATVRSRSDLPPEARRSQEPAMAGGATCQKYSIVLATAGKEP